MKILLTIAYDGTNYFGWQLQDDFVTIQGEMEKALAKLFNKRLEIRGASRTDRGVHAYGQRAVFTIDTTIPMQGIPYAINNILPRDIRVHSAKVVERSFHPQYDALYKIYTYKIYNSKFIDPILNNYTWHVPQQLDINKMQEAAKSLIGTYDFAAFCATGSSTKTTVRTIYSIDITTTEEKSIVIKIKGNGFLYNMVRIITGTLVYIGYGKLQVADMAKIIMSKDRTKGGITAPPQGLCLTHIEY